MWQYLGLNFLLLCCGLLQLFWPFPLLLGYPAPLQLLLLSGALVLLYLPRQRYYFSLLLLGLVFDLLLSDNLFTLVAFAVVLQLPLQRGQQEPPNAWQTAGWAALSVLCFEGLMGLMHSLYGTGAWLHLLKALPASLCYHFVLALLLRPLFKGGIQLLHYQRFEYQHEVMKGKLG